MTDFPTYICHKRVQAVEIASVEGYRQTRVPLLERKITYRKEGELLPIWLPSSMFVRYMPEPGDFLVIYEDGYQSFSPRKAFVEGYSPALDGNVLMERLNDLATAAWMSPVVASWLTPNAYVQQIARVARDAYVTINSLKQQVERLHKELHPIQEVADTGDISETSEECFEGATKKDAS